MFWTNFHFHYLVRILDISKINVIKKSKIFWNIEKKIRFEHLLGKYLFYVFPKFHKNSSKI